MAEEAPEQPMAEEPEVNAEALKEGGEGGDAGKVGEEEAAIKIQAIARGHRDRKRVATIKAQKEASPEVATAEAEAEEQGAEAPEPEQEQGGDAGAEGQAETEDDAHAAATKIQAVHRGRRDRKRVKQLKEERQASQKQVQPAGGQDEEMAAVKIQAVARGHRDRKRVATIKQEKHGAKTTHAAEQNGGDNGLLGDIGNSPTSKKVGVRQYLDSTVVPVLRQGLRALVKTRPDDPFEFLADYIRSHKPM